MESALFFGVKQEKYTIFLSEKNMPLLRWRYEKYSVFWSEIWKVHHFLE